VTQHLLFFGEMLAASSLFALLEIQVEGEQGWARNLPTWRVENRWTRLFYGKRPLTGYHLYFQLLVLALVHLPYAMGAPLRLQTEMRILAFYILFFVVEDFLWFVFNPAYGFRRFRREHIWWHAPAWWWIMPREYWIFVPLGLALYVLSL